MINKIMIKGVIRIAGEDECKHIIKFIGSGRGLCIMNVSFENNYFIESVRSRIYYFKEIFFLGLSKNNREIAALESFLLPEDMYRYTIDLGIIQFTEFDILRLLHQRLCSDLRKKGFKKIRMDVAHDSKSDEVLKKLGMDLEVVLKNEIGEKKDAYCYSQFLIKKWR